MRIRDQYETVQRHVFLYGYKRSKRRIIGEIDLVGVKKDGLDLYEVKCSYRIVKAKKQLRKAKRILTTTEALKQAINAYFYNGESGEIHPIVV